MTLAMLADAIGFSAARSTLPEHAHAVGLEEKRPSGENDARGAGCATRGLVEPMTLD
ncbi:MAG TPA: hypothetical protein VFB54_12065 [Burkholderiales bacterium]|nr:hypothetical protein [Burkholderiales bacterium]